MTRAELTLPHRPGQVPHLSLALLGLDPRTAGCTPLLACVLDHVALFRDAASSSHQDHQNLQSALSIDGMSSGLGSSGLGGGWDGELLGRAPLAAKCLEVVYRVLVACEAQGDLEKALDLVSQVEHSRGRDPDRLWVPSGLPASPWPLVDGGGGGGGGGGEWGEEAYGLEEGGAAPDGLGLGLCAAAADAFSAWAVALSALALESACKVDSPRHRSWARASAQKLLFGHLGGGPGSEGPGGSAGGEAMLGPMSVGRLWRLETVEDPAPPQGLNLMVAEQVYPSNTLDSYMRGVCSCLWHRRTCSCSPLPSLLVRMRLSIPGRCISLAHVLPPSPHAPFCSFPNRP